MTASEWMVGLEHRLSNARQEAYQELCEHLFDDDGGLRDEELAIASVPQLVGATSSRAAPHAAAILLQIAAAARRTRADRVLSALEALDTGAWRSAPAAVQGAVLRAVAIRDGGTAEDVEVIFDICDASATCDLPAAPRRKDVVAWCQGGFSVGDYAADSPRAFELLVTMAFTEGADLEALARGARDRGDAPGWRLDAAHRRLFHAVLAWRSGRAPELAATFPAHREDELALSSWILAAEGRDATCLGRLLALAGCASVEEVREREARRTLDARDVLAGFDESFS